MDHKICPQCGQPAVLAMMHCGRCGYQYPVPGAEPTMTFARPLSAASARELHRAGVKPARSPLPWLVALVVCALLGGVAVGSFIRRAPRPALPSAPLVTRGGNAIQLPPRRDPTTGIFVERESAKESPTVSVTNEDADTMHLLMKDRAGKVLHLTVAGHSTVSMQVPADRYDIAVSSDNPSIRPNYGDAVFRRHKEYSATFIQSPDYGPIHLGD